MKTFSLWLTSIFLMACALTAPLAQGAETPTAAPQTLPTVDSAPTDARLPLPTVSPASTAGAWESLLQQAQTAVPERYQFAVDQGAQITYTADGRSFYLLWLPQGSDPANPPPALVTLHGHASWAFDEFFLWQPYAAERGYGILALQWWFGGGEETSDYYLPQEMYPILENILRENHIRPQTVLLHGFSRGSANVYGLTALDRASGNNFFLLTIANAGGAASDFPINQSIEKGEFGAQPFANTHWVMVCGMNDPNPDRDGCPAMRRSRDWVTQYGGVVELLIEDPNGEHGAFHHNMENVHAALDVFDQLLAR